jgi:hypothetical protein
MKQEDIEDLVEDMIEADSEKVARFEKIDNIIHNSWELPKEWSDLGWIRKVVTTDGSDALKAATRVLSIKEPLLRILPLATNPETRDKFTDLERALMSSLPYATARLP